MSEEVDKLVDLFERPAKLVAITGATVDVTLTADAAKSVASVLRLLDGARTSISRDQAERILRIALDRVPLSILIKLWLMSRLLRWAKSKKATS